MKTTSFRIGRHLVGPGQRPYIIAEIGTNHDRSFAIAKKLIDMAADAKADAVKFQIYETEHIVNPFIRSSEYGFEKWYKEKYVHEIFSKYLQTPKEWVPRRVPLIRKRGLDMIAAVHSEYDARFVLAQRFDALKIASMELNNTVLLGQIARITRKPVILSSGMSELSEISEAVAILKKAGKDVALLHCISAYPPNFNEMRLRNIGSFIKKFPIPIGYSDHCPTNESAFAAIALGACILEKHISLDRKSPGPDHPFALEYEGLRELVERSADIFRALGPERFTRGPRREFITQSLARKSVVAKNNIRKGHVLHNADLILQRPGTGIPPKGLCKVLGHQAKKDIPKGSVISWKDLA